MLCTRAARLPTLLLRDIDPHPYVWQQRCSSPSIGGENILGNTRVATTLAVVSLHHQASRWTNIPTNSELD